MTIADEELLSEAIRLIQDLEYIGPEGAQLCVCCFGNPEVSHDDLCKLDEFLTKARAKFN